jgi:murein DD-endopeptidase MepM/ murein hydrolase activator NlpD
MERVFVGLMGSTGHSTGPHIHMQTKHDRSKLTPERVNSYFRFDGNKVDNDDVTETEEGHLDRGSRGLDLAPEGGSGVVIEALAPTNVSDMHYDDRSGYYRIVSFEDGVSILLAHLLPDKEPPKKQAKEEDLSNVEKTPVPPAESFNVENAEEKLDLIIKNLSF